MSSQGDTPAGDACARWDIPQISERSAAVGGQGGHAAVPGYEEGFAQGRAEALAAGQHVLQEQVATLQRLMGALTEPFNELDESVETELLSLATAVAKQVVRRELAADPQLVLAVIRDAIALLPVASRDVTLRLHPDDALLVREHMPAAAEEGQWRIAEDASCGRGGCVVTTGHARIDASIEQQIDRVADAVLGPVENGSTEI